MKPINPCLINHNYDLSLKKDHNGGTNITTKWVKIVILRMLEDIKV